ncbi:MAG: tetratricopeptide repeat protein [Longimicrobiales bacterium]
MSAGGQGDLLDPSDRDEPEDESGGEREGRKTRSAGVPEDVGSEVDSEETPTDRGGRERARARELVEEGRVEDAVALYGKLIRRNPDDWKARHNLGVLYDEIGAHEEALEQLDAALEVEPERVEILVNRSSVLAFLSRFDEAEEALRRAERLQPGSADVRRARGILSYRKGLYAEAVEELKRICGKDPEDGVARFYLGEALNRLGRVEEALDALEKAIEIQPRNHRAYYTMGILYDKLHLPQQAALMYRKSRKLQASS